MKKHLILLFMVIFSILTPATSRAASINAFEITRYDINYELGIDSENYSTLKTTEKITANFTNPNTNHGIERYLPNKYDGHRTALSALQVTDLNNNPLQFSTHTSDNNLVVRIGDPTKYVYGPMSYVITYTQKEVTKFFSGSNMDEWYWNTNGTEWSVPIKLLNISASISPDISERLTDKTACYIGLKGSQVKCNLQKRENTYSVTASNLNAYENVTLAVGFKPNTFSSHKYTIQDQIVWLLIVTNLLAIFIAAPLLIYGINKYRRQIDRTNERRPIVTQFLPPSDCSVSVAASVLGIMGGIEAAQILDLAVRGYIKIYEINQSKFFSQKDYEIEIIKSVADLRPEELELIKDIFYDGTSVGARKSLKTVSMSSKFIANITDNMTKVSNLTIDTYLLRDKSPLKSRWHKKVGVAFTILGLLTLNIAFFGVGLLLMSFSGFLKPLTDKGLEIARYLDGLKQYITIAEVDRIKVLQSVDGAEKIKSIDPNDKALLIHLYESILPYAVLFGLEKSWSKQLGTYYETTNEQPAWYVGAAPAFNAASFTHSINSFSSTTAAGGASGGGFSGGGGGGGGGGGW